MSDNTPDLTVYLAEIGDTIKELEDQWSKKGLCAITAKAGNLSWERNGRKHRICLDDKPFAETPVGARLAALDQLDELKAAVAKEAIALKARLEDWMQR